MANEPENTNREEKLRDDDEEEKKVYAEGEKMEIDESRQEKKKHTRKAFFLSLLLLPALISPCSFQKELKTQYYRYAGSLFVHAAKYGLILMFVLGTSMTSSCRRATLANTRALPSTSRRSSSRARPPRTWAATSASWKTRRAEARARTRLSWTSFVSFYSTPFDLLCHCCPFQSLRSCTSAWSLRPP